MTRNPKIPRKIHVLCQQNIKSFASSEDNFAALTEDGRLFMWGMNGSGQLGDGSEYYGSCIPKLVEGVLSNKKVVQIACGFRNTLALTDQGQILFWGSIWGSNYGSNLLLPERVTEAIGDRKAVAIACSRRSCHVLLEDGQLYSWGCCRISYMCIKASDKQPSTERKNIKHSVNPVRIDGLWGETVKQVVCGTEHCLVLTDSGRVFTWGSFITIQFKYNQFNYLQESPYLNVFGKAVQIAANGTTSAVKFEDGMMCVWKDMLCFSFWEFGCVTIDEAFAPKCMWRPIDLRTMAETLSLELDDRRTADVCFQVGDQQIWAHKDLLTQNILYFDVMFHLRWTEPKKTEFLLVDDYAYETFYAFLNHLYTEEPIMSSINWGDLYRLADFYGYGRLQLVCLNKINAIDQKLMKMRVGHCLNSDIHAYRPISSKPNCFEFKAANASEVVKIVVLIDQMLNTNKKRYCKTSYTIHRPKSSQIVNRVEFKAATASEAVEVVVSVGKNSRKKANRISKNKNQTKSN